MCHAVEVDHNGNHDASVAYIAATPSTEVNRKYVKAQLKDFLEGRAPEDFRHEGRRVSNEKEFKGAAGGKDIMCQEGRKAAGFDV